MSTGVTGGSYIPLPDVEGRLGSKRVQGWVLESTRMLLRRERNRDAECVARCVRNKSGRLQGEEPKGMSHQGGIDSFKNH